MNNVSLILFVGTKVHYVPKYFGDDEYQNGIIKEIPEDNPGYVRVVYHCNDDWINYKDYTSALTNIQDLRPGWIEK